MMDHELLIALAQLNVVWATLDYILRLVLKRIEGLSMLNPQNNTEQDRIEKIFGNLSHGSLIDQINSGLPTSRITVNMHVIQSLINKVGRDRSGTALYARRNTYIHALWAQTSDGQVLRQRIGCTEWRMSIHFSANDIQTLTSTPYS